jgi:hypothetical protein
MEIMTVKADSEVGWRGRIEIEARYADVSKREREREYATFSQTKELLDGVNAHKAYQDSALE